MSLDNSSAHNTIPLPTNSNDTVIDIEPQKEFDKDVYTRFLYYLITGTLSDITIMAPLPNDTDKYMTFNLHNFIVSSRSPMLAVQLQYSTTLTIDLTADIFQALVWAMYTDSNDHMPSHLLPEIFWAAEYYQIRPAQIWSLRKIISITSKDTVYILLNDIINAYTKTLDFKKDGITCPKYTHDSVPMPIRYLLEYIYNLQLKGEIISIDAAKENIPIILHHIYDNLNTNNIKTE